MRDQHVFHLGSTANVAALTVALLLCLYIAGYFAASRCVESGGLGRRFFNRPWQQIYRPLAWVEKSIRPNFDVWFVNN